MASNPKAPRCPGCGHDAHYPGLCDFGIADGECPCDRAASPLPAEPPPTRHKFVEVGNDRFCSACGVFDGERESSVFPNPATEPCPVSAATPSAAEPQKEE